MRFTLFFIQKKKNWPKIVLYGVKTKKLKAKFFMDFKFEKN